MPTTANAERVRAFRKRQLAQKPPKKPPKSGAQRVREFRARQKILCAALEGMELPVSEIDKLQLNRNNLQTVKMMPTTTNVERLRAFLKLHRGQKPPTKPPKSAAQRMKEFRARKKERICAAPGRMELPTPQVPEIDMLQPNRNNLQIVEIMPTTTANAERLRAFYKKQRAQKPPKKPPKSAAQRARECRARKKERICAALGGMEFPTPQVSEIDVLQPNQNNFQFVESMPTTANAEYLRAFYKKQRAQKPPKKPPKSAAQRARECRARRKERIRAALGGMEYPTPQVSEIDILQPNQNNLQFEQDLENYMLWKFANARLFLNEGMVPHGYISGGESSVPATEPLSSRDIDEYEESEPATSESDVYVAVTAYNSIPSTSEDPLALIPEEEDIKPNIVHKNVTSIFDSKQLHDKADPLTTDDPLAPITEEDDVKPDIVHVNFINNFDVKPLNDDGVGLMPGDSDLENSISIKQEVKEEVEDDSDINNQTFEDHTVFDVAKNDPDPDCSLEQDKSPTSSNHVLDREMDSITDSQADFDGRRRPNILRKQSLPKIVHHPVSYQEQIKRVLNLKDSGAAVMDKNTPTFLETSGQHLSNEKSSILNSSRVLTVEAASSYDDCIIDIIKEDPTEWDKSPGSS